MKMPLYKFTFKIKFRLNTKLILEKLFHENQLQMYKMFYFEIIYWKIFSMFSQCMKYS